MSYVYKRMIFPSSLHTAASLRTRAKEIVEDTRKFIILMNVKYA